MRGKTLLILLLLAAGLAAALFLVDSPEGQVDGATQARLGQPLFPDLKDKLNEVTALTVTGADGQVSVTRDGERWVVAAKDNYPANFDTLRSALIAVSNLQVLEARTTKPELFGKLGLEDPAGVGATSELVTLQGADGTPVASLIVGKTGPGRDTLYVRRATENLSWLARGPLDVPGTAIEWINLRLPTLEANRVKDVTVTHADGDVVTVGREKADDAIWAIVNMSEGMQPSSPTVGRVLAAALESVDFEDVRAADTAPLPDEQRAITVFTTFDGLRITATSAVADGKTWVTFVASKVDVPAAPAAGKNDADETGANGDGAAADVAAGDDAGGEAGGAEDGDDAAAAAAAASEAVTKEVADLNARLAPWVFALPDHRANNLRKHTSDLVQPKPAPKDPAPDEHAPHDVGTPEPGAGAPPPPDNAPR